MKHNTRTLLANVSLVLLLSVFHQNTFQFFYSLAQLFYFSTHLRQALDVRVEAFVFVERLNRNSPPHAGTYNLPRQNARLRAYHRAALHTDVVAEPDLPANHAIIFNRHAAADAGLRSNHNPLAKVAVMTDMNQVVDLRAPADARSAQRGAIDAGIRAEFD